MNAPFPNPRAAVKAQTLTVPHIDRPEHDARLLTRGGAEARIVLDGTPYVLRITRLGKLILTK